MDTNTPEFWANVEVMHPSFVLDEVSTHVMEHLFIQSNLKDSAQPLKLKELNLPAYAYAVHAISLYWVVVGYNEKYKLVYRKIINDVLKVDTAKMVNISSPKEHGWATAANILNRDLELEQTALNQTYALFNQFA